MLEPGLILFRTGFVAKPSISLFPEELAHLRALRLSKEETTIQIRDGEGGLYDYQFSPLSKELKFLNENHIPKKQERKTVAIALPKGNRFDFFLQKVTEIGLSSVVFLVFRHSIRKEFNLERAEKIVKEAAAQSKQTELLTLSIEPAGEWMKSYKDSLVVFHPHRSEIFSANHLLKKIPVIGPEGGFHLDEENWMEENKIPRLTLPGGVLRTETAGIVAASFLVYGT
ncbi:16S rRNA (uracil(1498)-N(3))-methyltransferase [Leptospira kanakyensis]|uniref:Ribosomal RNA small subunit methyltransferase E n=1 Tax=Leptospira kanakyensis TaxID=2484968 RepID=A0A6N4QID8_9LEPT|nr:RsmE family RNA methyltransferase [Leptospira kanakyensis]MCW7470273.1 16S rRNA (uracil(1498)-N(3))-methyltransferase [Leptospira kanakyensis]MCW7481364.1 16S rRNA (uracil(1498)-N(3))-methyltransferase [Leptospira kanakyensis]TGK54082.1 16S rRNA (uracil(1498)-N(3))-methyltransferase [Leptospira kanakyensis]TGK57877.1 16S rRNA (uracil(1498)-N(3))-methyltransferase [Leptospira kanakyensis]TGK73586.1 16S rRNA (uracil(1498)-N(3))-methyltransferase [Leptospira kanakyensis]